MAWSLIVLMIVLAGCVTHQPPTRNQDSCEALRSLTFPGAQVTAAERVAPSALMVAPADVAEGTQNAVNAALAKLPAFCRVKVAAKPGPGSDIRIEVWLPATGWNGRLQAVGDGGLAGYIPFGLMAPALEGGYATAGTDTGHVGANVDFMPGNPDKLLDFAYRSTHQLAKAAKAVINAHYGRPARWAYYNACSGGGRHGLTSAQRFPEDFDGIVSGRRRGTRPGWTRAASVSISRSTARRRTNSRRAITRWSTARCCRPAMASTACSRTRAPAGSTTPRCNARAPTSPTA